MEKLDGLNHDSDDLIDYYDINHQITQIKKIAVQTK